MHNPSANPQKCYNEARDSEIKSHRITVRSHQIAKKTIHISAIQQDILKNFFVPRQEKANAVEGKKTFISLIVLLNF